jgi:integrase/recombinase XerD
MTPLRRRMLEDMQLRGLAERTQESYLAAVQQLAIHYAKSPDLITDEEVRQYFLYLRNVKHLAPNTVNVALNAVKFLYTYTLQRPWPFRDLIRPHLPQKLPIVLSVEEVWQLIGQIRLPHYRACLSVIYTCGLRLLEGVRLQVSQIDSARMQLHIRGGKGNKDRAVPLPEQTLTLLRAHWLSHRNPVWLFPGRGPNGCERRSATAPMNESALQKAFHRAVQEGASISQPPCIVYAIPGRPTCSNAVSTCA